MAEYLQFDPSIVRGLAYYTGKHQGLTLQGSIHCLRLMLTSDSQWLPPFQTSTVNLLSSLTQLVERNPSETAMGIMSSALDPSLLRALSMHSTCERLRRCRYRV